MDNLIIKHSIQKQTSYIRLNPDNSNVPDSQKSQYILDINWKKPVRKARTLNIYWTMLIILIVLIDIYCKYIYIRQYFPRTNSILDVLLITEIIDSITCIWKQKFINTYILSLICFAKIDLSEQSCIEVKTWDVMKSPFQAKHITCNS